MSACVSALRGEPSLRQDLLEKGQAVEHAGEPDVGDAVDQCADDLLLGQAHVEPDVDVQLQLRLGAQGDQRGDRHQRLLLLRQAWAAGS